MHKMLPSEAAALHSMQQVRTAPSGDCRAVIEQVSACQMLCWLPTHSSGFAKQNTGCKTLTLESVHIHHHEHRQSRNTGVDHAEQMQYGGLNAQQLT